MNTKPIHTQSLRLVREILRLTFCLAACFAVTSVPAQTLLFDFPFNEGSGTNVNSTTNSLTGTLGVGLVDVGCDPFDPVAYVTNSDPSFSSDTPSGLPGDYSLAFDDIADDTIGCRYAGERVRVADPGGVVDVADPAGTNFTFQCWVKLTAQPESRTTIFDCNAPGLRVNLGINGDRTLLFTATGIDDVTSTAEVVDDGGWHHIAMVHEDGVEVRFYIDGILRDAVAYTNGVQTGGLQAYFNIAGEVWDWPFPGSMVHPVIGNLDRISLTKGIVAANDLDWRPVPGVDPQAPALGIGFTTITSLPPVISVNMTDGGSEGGPLATKSAGAALASYWNEIAPNGTGLGGTDLNNLTDNSGAASGVSLVQSDGVGGWWNSDFYPSGFSGTMGNDMFGNFADTDFAYTYTFSNVSAGVSAPYDVYIYSARGFTNTGVTQFDVNGETTFLANESTVGDYAESGWSSQALAEANPDSGNYVRFQNVSLDTLVVGINGLEDLTNGGNNGSVAGLQIVSLGPGEPMEAVDISWPTVPAGYKLQSTTNIADTNSWVDVAESPSAVGTGAYHYYGAKSAPQMFYRLIEE